MFHITPQYVPSKSASACWTGLGRVAQTVLIPILADALQGPTSHSRQVTTVGFVVTTVGFVVTTVGFVGMHQVVPLLLACASHQAGRSPPPSVINVRRVFRNPHFQKPTQFLERPYNFTLLK